MAVALKVLHPAGCSGKDLTLQQQRELTVLQAAKHPNVVKLIGACLWRNQASTGQCSARQNANTEKTVWSCRAAGCQELAQQAWPRQRLDLHSTVPCER